jgi:hypothetical protein
MQVTFAVYDGYTVAIAGVIGVVIERLFILEGVTYRRRGTSHTVSRCRLRRIMFGFM